MTRKDTIMMAAVVNAALLIVLFISAIKKEEKAPVALKKPEVAEVTKRVPAVEPKREEVKVAQGDEIDRVLKDFSEKKVAAKEVASAPKIDFAKELEAITKAASVPAKKPTASSIKGSHDVEIVVKKGDVLGKIAAQYQVSVHEIMEYNHLKSSVLQIGQVLRIPGKEKVVASQKSGDPDMYVVKQGDNPWTIAVKNHIKVEELLRLNHLNEEKARQLRPGDKLRIR
jgi:peptidoglycan DL-endopeptidase LytF